MSVVFLESYVQSNHYSFHFKQCSTADLKPGKALSVIDDFEKIIMETSNLKTGEKYIKDIFSPGQFYNIPEYQRPYVWQEEQICALLDDISKAMEYDFNKEYFLGCMIWNTRKQKDRNGREYSSQDILDGQQRFITLFLLHGVIRDISQKSNLKDNVHKRLVQEADEYNNIPSRNRIEFEIRSDKEFLDSFVVEEGGTCALESLKLVVEATQTPTSIRNMAAGILIIQNWWETKFGEITNDSQIYLSDFYTYLSTKVLALFLATPNNLDDAYNLFTVLNSRGLQLQASDILRAQNLRVIDDEKTRKYYATKWSEFENSISAPFKNFDDFLWSMVSVKMKYRSDDNMSLAKAFEFMFKRGLLKKGPDTFEFFEKYIKHFESITDRSIVSKETQNLFGNLNFILSTVYGSQYITPLMHFRECFGESRIIEFIIKLDNLLSASWLTGRRQSNTRIFIILRKMDSFSERAKKNELTKEQAIEQFLLDPSLSYDFYDESISSEKPINLDVLFDTLENDKWGSFAGTKVNKTRYLLLKLDLLIGSPATILQYNKDSSSIEHLMPQAINSNSWIIDNELHKEWVHRLGNLVLIDKNKNSSLSNKSFKDKKIKYQGAIETRANTNYVFITNTQWDIEAIQNNQKRMIRLLKHYYKGNSMKTYFEIRKSLGITKPVSIYENF